MEIETTCCFTGQTVRYARKLGRELTIIQPETLEIIREKKTEPALQ